MKNIQNFTVVPVTGEPFRYAFAGVFAFKHPIVASHIAALLITPIPAVILSKIIIFKI